MSDVVKHTPGPWEAEIESYRAKVGAVDGMYIVKVGFGDLESKRDEQIANARLIAAAPELIDALDYLLAQTVDMDLNYGIELTEGEEEARTKKESRRKE